MVAVLLMAPMLQAARAEAGAQVPDAVLKSFQKEYPKAKAVHWSKDNEGYLVSFDQHRNHLYVVFSDDGSTIRQVVEIEKIFLPRNIRKQIEKNYKGFVIEDAARIHSGKSRSYETIIACAEEALDLKFSAEGKIQSVLELDKIFH